MQCIQKSLYYPIEFNYVLCEFGDALTHTENILYWILSHLLFTKPNKINRVLCFSYLVNYMCFSFLCFVGFPAFASFTIVGRLLFSLRRIYRHLNGSCVCVYICIVDDANFWIFIYRIFTGHLSGRFDRLAINQYQIEFRLDVNEKIKTNKKRFHMEMKLAITHLIIRRTKQLHIYKSFCRGVHTNASAKTYIPPFVCLNIFQRCWSSTSRCCNAYIYIFCYRIYYCY